MGDQFRLFQELLNMYIKLNKLLPLKIHIANNKPHEHSVFAPPFSIRQTRQCYLRVSRRVSGVLNYVHACTNHFCQSRLARESRVAGGLRVHQCAMRQALPAHKQGNKNLFFTTFTLYIYQLSPTKDSYISLGEYVCARPCGPSSCRLHSGWAWLSIA